MFKKSINTFEESYAEIANFALKTIPADVRAKMATEEGLSMADYMTKYRCMLNASVMQLCFGTTAVRNRKNELVIKFNRPMMTEAQAIKVCALMEQFCAIENDLFAAAGQNSDDDDMGIPIDATKQNPEIKNATEKMAKSILQGTAADASFLNSRMSATDLMYLYTMGKQIRKKKHIKQAVLIGITIAVVAVGIYFLICWMAKGDDETCDCEGDKAGDMDDPIDDGVIMDDTVIIDDGLVVITDEDVIRD